MNTSTDEIGKAVVLYLGFGRSPYPRQDQTCLVEEFGTQRAVDLQNRVQTLLREASQISVDWSVHSIVSAGKLASAEIASRHPELSEPALRAIEWKFTYDWR